jgi:hypothetical protein
VPAPINKQESLASTKASMFAFDSLQLFTIMHVHNRMQSRSKRCTYKVFHVKHFATFSEWLPNENFISQSQSAERQRIATYFIGRKSGSATGNRTRV